MNFLFLLAGVALVLLPSLGRIALTFFFLAWVPLLMLTSRKKEDGIQGEFSIALSGLALVVIGGLLGAIAYGIDFLLLETTVRGAGLEVIPKLLNRYAVRLQKPLLLTASILLSLFVAWQCHIRGGHVRGGKAQQLRSFVLGLSIGTLCCVAFFLAQFFDLHPFFSQNRNAFWNMTGRYTASFADPNAFGIMSFLLLPYLLLFSESKTLKTLSTIAGVALLFCLPWSGSRTAWLGIVLFIFVMTGRKFTKSKSDKGWTAWLVGAIVLVGVFAMIGSPKVNSFLQQNTKSPGLSRLIKTASWENGSEMFRSRALYSQIALATWKENPWLGVGLHRFYKVQTRVAKSIGINLGTWKDNANNFYFQVLAEEGLVGFIILLLSLLVMARLLSHESDPALAYYERAPEELEGGFQGKDAALAAKNEEEKATENHFRLLTTMVMAVFLILLITGPHILFAEVRFLVAMLLGLSVPSLSSSANKSPGTHLVLKFLAGIVVIAWAVAYTALFYHSWAQAAPRGLYKKELGPDGEFAWTAKDARIWLCPRKANRLGVKLQAFRSDPGELQRNPLQVQVSLEGQGKVVSATTLKLDHPKWVELSFDNLNVGSSYLLKLSSSQIWSPSSHGLDDRRWFGVILAWPDETCAW